MDCCVHTSVPTGELFAGPHRTLGRAGPVPLLVVGLPTVVPLPLPTPTCIVLAPPEMSQVQNSRPQAEGPAAVLKPAKTPWSPSSAPLPRLTMLIENEKNMFVLGPPTAKRELPLVVTRR